MYMIEHGPDIKSQIENGLAKLNSHRKGTKIFQHIRHSSDHEHSFAIYTEQKKLRKSQKTMQHKNSKANNFSFFINLFRYMSSVEKNVY